MATSHAPRQRDRPKRARQAPPKPQRRGNWNPPPYQLWLEMAAVVPLAPKWCHRRTTDARSTISTTRRRRTTSTTTTTTTTTITRQATAATIAARGRRQPPDASTGTRHTHPPATTWRTMPAATTSTRTPSPRWTSASASGRPPPAA